MKKEYLTPYADYARTRLGVILTDGYEDGHVNVGGSPDTTQDQVDFGKNRFPGFDDSSSSLNGGNGVTWDF